MLVVCFFALKKKKKKNCSINDSKINNATHNHKKKNGDKLSSEL